MAEPKDLFSPTPIFVGFALSGLYGILSSFALLGLGCDADIVYEFINAYFVKFNSAISGGLVFATAFTVYRTQNHVNKIVEDTFSKEVLAPTGYNNHRKNFENAKLSIRFSSTFAAVAFVMFWASGFPFEDIRQSLMIIAACLQYAAGVYIGRKIFHIGRMIRAISHAPVTPSLFTEDKLSEVSPYVTYVSVLTAATVYVAVTSYYSAPFAYDGFGREAMRAFMLFPAVIAIPVLIFAYSPRTVVRRLYERSIETILWKLKEQAKRDKLSEFESVARVIELRKTLYDELNARLKTTLEDVPMVIVLGVALLSVVKS